MEKVSFMSACSAFFGLLPGQSKMDFGREVLKLSDEDREEIAAGLIKNGVSIKEETIKKGSSAV